MKIQKLQYLQFNQQVGKTNNSASIQDVGNSNNMNYSQVTTNKSYFPNISFTSFPNSSELRELYKYDIPCIYSGIIMIDPSKIREIDNRNLLANDSKSAVQVLERFEKSMFPKEKLLFNLVKKQSKTNPDKDLNQIMQILKVKYKEPLMDQQKVIFNVLEKRAQGLPQENKVKFNRLMRLTYDMINEKEVVIAFSKRDFSYDLMKKFKDCEDEKFTKHLNDLCETFPHHKEPQAEEKQLHILGLIKNAIETETRSGRIKKDRSINDLFKKAEKRIKKEPMIVPFSNKSFIYGLEKALNGNFDINLTKNLIDMARNLPTSQSSLAAHVVKLADEHAENIGLKFLYPSMGTIEHIQPRLFGGENVRKNYALASSKFNGQRAHSTLYDYVGDSKEVLLNVQKHMDRLIELYNNGTFKKVGLSAKYIYNLKETLAQQSDNLISLDISKMRTNEFPVKNKMPPNDVEFTRTKTLVKRKP